MKRVVVGIVGDATAALLLAAPGITFWSVVKDKDVQERTCYPYLATLLNCISWVLYGIPQKNWVVVSINGVGILAEAVYCGLYIAFSAGKQRLVAIMLLLAEFVLAAILVTILFTVFRDGNHSEARDTTFGILGAVTGGGIMYVSPVKDMVNMIKTRDRTNMSPPLVICSLANGITWTIYASLKPISWFILLPNVLGILCASVQIVVYVLALLKLCCFKQQQ